MTTHCKSYLKRHQEEVAAGAVCAECGVFFVKACGYKVICNDCAKWSKRQSYWRRRPLRLISPYPELEVDSCRDIKWVRNKYKGNS